MQNLLPEIKTAIPGPKAKALIARDDKSASPSLIKVVPLVVERGEGVWLYDVDGNRFLDFMAGIAVCSTGHSHPKVVKAIKDAADKFLHICLTDFYYESATRLCEKLSSLVPGMGKTKVFLTNSGTEAVEGAIKLARYHTRRPNIIAFKGAFHGRTLGAIALNGSKNTQRAFFGPFMPGVLHVPYANPYRCAYKNTPDFCGTSCVCGGPAIEKDWFLNYMDPKEVAAILVEPIQGEGGFIMPPKKFLQDLRALCDKHGIVLIFDEIQSGAGRTGKMYAHEHYGVSPDILLTAKGIASGMPVGAFIAKESIMTWGKGSHGSTYAGNPLCCEAALATIEIIEEMLPQIQQSGDVLLKGLRELQKKHKIIGDVRGTGLMVGAEFVNPATKDPAPDYVDDLEQITFLKGLVLLTAGKSSIRFCPPLIITPREIKIALDIIDECMTELDKKYATKYGL